jgi:citrate lyase subunit beta/citryl-CoA lyase
MAVEVLTTAQASKTAQKLFVRMNALDTPHALEDLAAVVRAKPYGIMLPKSRGGEDARLVSNYLTALEAREGLPQGGIVILPIATETGAAMFGVGTYHSPAIPRLAGLTWGAEDLAADMGAMGNRDAAGRYTPAFELGRTLCVLGASAASTIAVDGVYIDFRDMKGLEAETLEGLRMGYSAKMAIHPDQIEVINRAFTPTPESLQWAEKVLAAFAANPGAGVINMDGKMVDIPHFKAATRIVARSKAAAGD